MSLLRSTRTPPLRGTVLDDHSDFTSPTTAPLSHKAINHELGLDNAYTRQVEAFLASLGAGLQQRLQP